MRASVPFLLAVLSALAAVGCGNSGAATPAACLNGPGAYLTAVEDAPKAVRLDGGASISECLGANQEGGALASVGASMLSASTKLNAAARAEPGGAANLRLGYLLGAAERGAEESAGIHAELIRRLRAAALYSPAGHPLAPAFRHAYRQGFEAGHTRG